MPIALYQVDSFTNRLYRGNPAAVCLLPAARDADWMQSVAAEMNLSETAFVVPRSDAGEPGYDLRWFTPQVEVDLCGHATLASAHILWETGRLGADESAHFHTRSGLLTAARADGAMEMDFPLQPVEAASAPAGLTEALGVTPQFVGRAGVDYLVLLDRAEAIAALHPDFPALAKVEARGVMVTAPGDGQYDFVSRFFGPRVGINEDPVTGSAHCALAPFWGERLGKSVMTAHQVSPRGGVLRVRVEPPRVRLGGEAVTVFEAQLRD